MAKLPEAATESQTVRAIYAYWEAQPQRLGRRLGASQIGQECERRLWYSFRWCLPGGQFDGRMLRLFNRGHREEPVFVTELLAIGYEVLALDPTTGEQFEFKACGGHFVAKIDGAARGVFDAPKTWHNLSFKTINAKGHAELVKKGVQVGKPEHYAQNQIEMKLSEFTRTLYLSANKDTDELYSERIRYDAQFADNLEAKAERVIFAAEPPAGLSDDPAHYKCKFCPASTVCHTPKLPAVSCRTCLHATPEKDGDGRWSCALAPGESIPQDVQHTGCPSHLYIPALLKRWGEPTDASAEEGWVEYTAADGLVFRNGPWGVNSYTSKELSGWTPALLRSPEFAEIRAKYEARFLSDAELEEAA